MSAWGDGEDQVRSRPVSSTKSSKSVGFANDDGTASTAQSSARSRISLRSNQREDAEPWKVGKEEEAVWVQGGIPHPLVHLPY